MYDTNDANDEKNYRDYNINDNDNNENDNNRRPCPRPHHQINHHSVQLHGDGLHRGNPEAASAQTTGGRTLLAKACWEDISPAFLQNSSHVCPGENIGPFADDACSKASCCAQWGRCGLGLPSWSADLPVVVLHGYGVFKGQLSAAMMQTKVLAVSFLGCLATLMIKESVSSWCVLLTCRKIKKLDSQSRKQEKTNPISLEDRFTLELDSDYFPPSFLALKPPSRMVPGGSKVMNKMKMKRTR